MAIEHAIRAGEALAAVKAQLAHGEWLPWLAENFAGSERMARNYLKIAANRQRAADLPEPSLRKALAAIAGTARRAERDVPIVRRFGLDGSVSTVRSLLRPKLEPTSASKARIGELLGEAKRGSNQHSVTAESSAIHKDDRADFRILARAGELDLDEAEWRRLIRPGVPLPSRIRVNVHNRCAPLLLG